MDDTTPDQTSKRSAVEELLEQGMVLVTVDATADDVTVPEHLQDDPQLRLNLSFRFGLPMELDDWGVRATLTFAGHPFDCRLPWSSIYLIVSHVSGRPVLFPRDVPESLMQAFAEATRMQTEEGEGEIEPIKQRPKLTVVREEQAGDKIDDDSGDGDDRVYNNPNGTPPDDPPPAAPPLTGRRRRHLKVVK